MRASASERARPPAAAAAAAAAGDAWHLARSTQRSVPARHASRAAQWSAGQLGGVALRGCGFFSCADLPLPAADSGSHAVPSWAPEALGAARVTVLGAAVARGSSAPARSPATGPSNSGAGSGWGRSGWQCADYGAQSGGGALCACICTRPSQTPHANVIVTKETAPWHQAALGD